MPNSGRIGHVTQLLTELTYRFIEHIASANIGLSTQLHDNTPFSQQLRTKAHWHKMTQFLDLAPEILTHIIRMVSKSINPNSHDVELYKIALVSRTLHQVTEPFLYTKYIQGDRKLLRLFLRTILEKPQYAARVKYLHLEEIFDDYYEDEEDEDEEDEDEDEDSRIARDEMKQLENERELALLKNAFEQIPIARNMPQESRQIWPSALEERNIDALSILLIFSLPNLEVLSRTRNRDEIRPFMESFMTRNDRIAENWKSLSNLKLIHFSHEYPDSCIDISEIKPFLSLPSLRTVSVYGISVENFSWDPILPARGKS
jgi:hypothetical protein